MADSKVVGVSHVRKEGLAKVLGRTRYTDDLTEPGLLHGVTVRAPIPRGKVLDIVFEEGLPWEEFTVVTAGDLKAQGFCNEIASIVNDQPVLVDGMINHAEEPVVLLAHPDKAMAEAGRAKVRIVAEPLPAVLDIPSSLDRKAVVYGQDNLIKEIWIRKGDPDSVWDQAAHVFEGEYHTGAQEHAYIETNAMTARFQPGAEEDRVVVSGSLQCPYYVHKALTHLFNLEDKAVRVIQLDTGGAFGGKEDYPSMLGAHAALLAWKSGRPVKMVYDREEDMAATTKRHPSRTRIRSAFDAEGKLLALDVDFVLDAGAYTTLSTVVLSRGSIHAGGVYRCPHSRIHGRAVATNTPPNGAFRGFGAPQSFFALERHMDVAAARLGIDPAELRRRNFLRIGDTLPTGQIIKEDLDLAGMMDKALQEIGYAEKRKAFDALNEENPAVRKGLGISVFMHGCGFTGSAESWLASVAGLEGTAEGKVRVLAASTEIGQGKDTVFSQIAAETLGIPYDQVEVARPDTRVVPNSGPTVASRSTMIVGKLIQTAAVSLKQTLVQEGFLKAPWDGASFAQAVKDFIKAKGALKAYSQYQTPPHIVWDDATYQGDAYPGYAWACYAAEVSLDTVTFEVKVDDFVAVQEIGRVLNPTLAAGQIEGGAAQGIGWGLWEDVQWRQGRMINNQMTNYIIPTSADLPRIRVFFMENPHPMGPEGAKGIGELPMDGPAPALVNALQHASGVTELRHAPMTPERLMEALVDAEVCGG